MSEDTFDKSAAVKLLNNIMEAELAGVVRYTHYSLMVFGHNRIPIVSWLRNESEHLPHTCKRSGRVGDVFWRTPVPEDRRPARNAQTRHQRHTHRISRSRKNRTRALQRTLRARSRSLRLTRRLRAPHDCGRRTPRWRSEQDASKARRHRSI